MSDTIKGFRGKDGPILLDFSGLANVPGAIQSIGALTARPGDHFEAETVDDTGKIITVKAVEKPGGGSGQNVALTATERSTLIAVVNAIGVFNGPNGQELIDAFNAAWGGTAPDEPEPEKTLTGITAVYTGGSVPVGTAVSALTGVVVTASYSDGTTEAVTGYTLSGTIAEGSNTVTVSYGGKTASFAVTGVAESTGEDVIDLAPYIKAENKRLHTFYQGNTIRWADAEGENIYSVPVEAGAYRMSALLKTQYDTLGFAIQNESSDRIGVGKLPLLAQDTDLSTNAISYANAASCTHEWEGESYNYTSILTIEFAAAGYFLFSIKPSQNVAFVKVVA